MSFKNMPDIGSGITAEQLQSMTPEETMQWIKREKEKDVKKKQLAKRLKVNGINQENRYFKSITIKENDEVELIMNEKVFMGVNNETGKEIWKSIPISVGPIPYGRVLMTISKEVPVVKEAYQNEVAPNPIVRSDHLREDGEAHRIASGVDQGNLVIHRR